MHSVLSSFFTGPISGEEKKRRLVRNLQCVFYFLFLCKSLFILVLAESVIKDDPTRYLLTLEQMIENDYPIPSYMADVFEKPPGWVEIPEPKATEYKLGRPKVYAIDCEMVWFIPIMGYSTWADE
jgi:RNA exonuclease 1